MQIYRSIISIIVLFSALTVGVSFAKEDSFNSIVERDGRLVKVYIPSTYQSNKFYEAHIVFNDTHEGKGMSAELRAIDLNEFDMEYKDYHLVSMLLDKEFENDFKIKVLYKNYTSESFDGCYKEVDILLNSELMGADSDPEESPQKQ